MKFRIKAHVQGNATSELATALNNHRPFREAIRGSVLRLLNPSRFVPAAGDTILNYGSSAMIHNPNGRAINVINEPRAVSLATHKLNFFDAIREYNGREGVEAIPVLDSTSSKEVAESWLDSPTARVYCRTVLQGHSGEGIVVSQAGDTLPNARLYTRGVVGSRREYRVHVFDGHVILIQKKLRRNVTEENPTVNNEVRNLDGNWVFGIATANPSSAVTTACINTVNALGLDFGAVDVITTGREGQENSIYVVEVNTAPGMGGETTISRYVSAITHKVLGLAPFDQNQALAEQVDVRPTQATQASEASAVTEPATTITVPEIPTAPTSSDTIPGISVFGFAARTCNQMVEIRNNTTDPMLAEYRRSHLSEVGAACAGSLDSGQLSESTRAIVLRIFKKVIIALAYTYSVNTTGGLYLSYKRHSIIASNSTRQSVGNLLGNLVRDIDNFNHTISEMVDLDVNIGHLEYLLQNTSGEDFRDDARLTQVYDFAKKPTIYCGVLGEILYTRVLSNNESSEAKLDLLSKILSSFSRVVGTDSAYQRAIAVASDCSVASKNLAETERFTKLIAKFEEIKSKRVAQNDITNTALAAKARRSLQKYNTSGLFTDSLLSRIEVLALGIRNQEGLLTEKQRENLVVLSRRTSPIQTSSTVGGVVYQNAPLAMSEDELSENRGVLIRDLSTSQEGLSLLSGWVSEYVKTLKLNRSLYSSIVKITKRLLGMPLTPSQRSFLRGKVQSFISHTVARSRNSQLHAILNIKTIANLVNSEGFCNDLRVLILKYQVIRSSGTDAVRREAQFYGVDLSSGNLGDSLVLTGNRTGQSSTSRVSMSSGQSLVSSVSNNVSNSRSGGGDPILGDNATVAITEQAATSGRGVLSFSLVIFNGDQFAARYNEESEEYYLTGHEVPVPASELQVLGQLVAS